MEERGVFQDMVHYSLAGCVEHTDYTICERLLDIMATALPDITVEKLPYLAAQWPTRAVEIAQQHGFQAVNERDIKIAQVLVWRIGRIVSHRAEEFELYVLENYGFTIDLSKVQVDLYTKANTEAIEGPKPIPPPEQVDDFRS